MNSDQTIWSYHKIIYSHHQLISISLLEHLNLAQSLLPSIPRSYFDTIISVILIPYSSSSLLISSHSSIIQQQQWGAQTPPRPRAKRVDGVTTTEAAHSSNIHSVLLLSSSIFKFSTNLPIAPPSIWSVIPIIHPVSFYSHSQ